MTDVDISNVIEMYKRNRKIQNRQAPLGYKNNKNAIIEIFQKPPKKAINTNHKVIIPMTDYEKRVSKEIEKNLNIKVGTRVRHIIKHNIYTKRSFQNNYSRNVYTVTKINNNRYSLNNAKSYLRRELIVANEPSSELLSEISEISENRRKNRQAKRVRRLNDFKHTDAEIDYISEDGTPVFKERLRPKHAKRRQ